MILFYILIYILIAMCAIELSVLIYRKIKYKPLEAQVTDINKEFITVSYQCNNFNHTLRTRIKKKEFKKYLSKEEITILVSPEDDTVIITPYMLNRKIIIKIVHILILILCLI